MKWLKSLLGRSDEKPEPVDVATVSREGANLWMLRIGGMLNKTTLERVQSLVVPDILRGAKVKVLVILTDFKGWREGDDWGDIDFFARYEKSIARIAVVGRGEWKDSTLTFLGAGARSGEVHYFLPPQEVEARAWLVR